MSIDRDVFRQGQSDDYLAGTNAILDLSQQEQEPYEIEVQGNKFIVHLGVFSPKYFDDTEFFIESLIDYGIGDSFLEIGTGTGIIAVCAAQQGVKKVVATDIANASIQNAKENVRRFGLEDVVDVRQGDVYSVIKDDEKFDTIFWNIPWGYVEGKISDLEHAVHDPEYKSIKKFILNGQKYLNKNGNLLAGFSSSLGRKDLIDAYASEAGLKIEIIRERPATENNPVSVELLEFKKTG